MYIRGRYTIHRADNEIFIFNYACMLYTRRAHSIGHKVLMFRSLCMPYFPLQRNAPKTRTSVIMFPHFRYLFVTNSFGPGTNYAFV